MSQLCPIFPDDLHTRLVQYVQSEILLAIGTTISGAQTDIGQEYIATAKAKYDCKEAIIIGDGTRISATDAFYLNSILSNLGEYPESSNSFPSHPGRLVILAGLSAAEKLGAHRHDLIKATLLCYELIMQTHQAIRDCIFSESTSYPNVKMIKYLSLPHLANIVGIIMEKLLKDKQQNLLTVLLQEMLAILKSITDVDVTVLPESSDLLEVCSDRIEQLPSAKSYWMHCLTREIGLGPSLFNNLILAYTQALGRAISMPTLTPEHIAHIRIMFPFWMDEYVANKIGDAKAQIATAAFCFTHGAQLGQSWFLNDVVNHPEISAICEKTKFVSDIGDLLKDKNFSSDIYIAYVHTLDRRIQKGIVRFPIVAFRGLLKEKPKKIFTDSAIVLFNAKSVAELYLKLTDSDEIKISELMDLTYPKVRTRRWLEKTGLLVNKLHQSTHEGTH